MVLDDGPCRRSRSLFSLRGQQCREPGGTPRLSVSARAALEFKSTNLVLAVYLPRVLRASAVLRFGTARTGRARQGSNAGARSICFEYRFDYGEVVPASSLSVGGALVRTLQLATRGYYLHHHRSGFGSPSVGIAALALPSFVHSRVSARFLGIASLRCKGAKFSAPGGGDNVLCECDGACPYLVAASSAEFLCYRPGMSR